MNIFIRPQLGRLTPDQCRPAVKSRRNSWYAILVCVLAWLDLSAAPSTAVAAPVSFLHTQGQDIVNEQGEKILLRGVGLGNWLLPEGYMWKFGNQGDRPRKIEKLVSDLIGHENSGRFWTEFRKNYITEADIQLIAKLGYNSVRPALNSRLFLSATGVPTGSEEGFLLLDNLIAWSKANGIYVILDMHGAPGGQTGQNIDDSANDLPELFMDPKYEQQLTALWQAIARRYKDEPAVAGYDLLNEPLPERTGAAKKYKAGLEPMYQRLTQAIREIDPRHMIILEGADWANDWTVFSKPFDANLVYQFHYYCWDNPATVKNIRRYLDYRARFNAPVWVGETGERDNAIYWATTEYFEANNIGWSFWPWKKMDTQNTPLSIQPPAQWASIIAYSQGGEKPSRAAAQKTLDELLVNLRLANCVVHPEVINAMFRRAPVRIEAENYGHGGPDKSYRVADTNQLSKYYRLSEPVPVTALEGSRRQSDQYISLNSKEWTAYAIDSDSAKNFKATLRARAVAGSGEAQWSVGEQIHSVVISSAAWSEIELGTIALNRGANQLKWLVTKGAVDLDWVNLSATEKSEPAAMGGRNNLALADSSATAQAEQLLAQMTLDEKIGQMTQVDMLALSDKNEIARYFLGSVLSGGSSDPADNSPASWLKTVEEFKSAARNTRLEIPLLYAIDAVHGHNNVDGAVIFPHNLGLGATHDAALVEKAARVTAEEVAGTGIRWAFAPCIAVVQDAHWGRTYESFGDATELVAELGVAAIHGLQGQRLADATSILACAKHFIGDGGTQDGIDQGNTVCDEATLRKLYLPPYQAAVQAGVGSVMVSYSSWNGKKMHGNKYLITDVLKGELGFKGFVVSDWAAIDQLSDDYKADVEASINAGLDMVMIPHGPGKKNNYVEFITALKELVAEGKVSPSRIDDAVRRILQVKFQLGLFGQSAPDPQLTAAIGSPAHRQVARECVRASLVLLKDSNHVLPLAKNLKRLVVVGAAADDLGIQCGGWTIDWQGRTGAVTRGGTTVLAAIRQAVAPGTQVIFSPDGRETKGADAIVVVVGELPYAEMKGDRDNLDLSNRDSALIQKAKTAGAPVVTILFSGRPLVLGRALETSDAFIAAWLPGTEGQGITDVLFGDYKPTGKLPRAWPTGSQSASSSAIKPLFQAGFGLAD